MLQKFIAKNFKNFSEIEFDLFASRNYEFNSKSIRNGLVRVAQIYGVNGSGKSNLGLAMTEIISHLTDNASLKEDYENYTNANLIEQCVDFEYHFKINDSLVIYKYWKANRDVLLSEHLSINGEVVIVHDRSSDNLPIVKLDGAESLNLENLQYSNMSTIKYVYKNTALPKSETSDAFIGFMKYVETMLYFRPVKDNKFQGLAPKAKSISQYIVDNNKIDDLESFFKEAGIDCKLGIQEISGKQSIVSFFGNNWIDFISTASTGTMSLLLLYFWLDGLRDQEKDAFVFIDEFDAFYHFSLAEFVVKKLVQLDKHQFVLTTHNTALLSNDILRPDCNFILKESKIKSLSELSSKELRTAHNIEKMYRAGSFNG